ncbi:unnamed protein product [Pieris brassicae]|uniref:Uncharacterized protein n=1 Tax=Pieris brassicae TaxID=7116 RepID=A0A9P0TDH0_PIEBR|nr:unnamed protein product [Pieris brassicae]
MSPILMCILFVAMVQSRVIKIDKIPIKSEMIMKIAFQMNGKGDPVANIKFIEKETKNQEVDKTLKPPVGFIPDFNNRAGILGGKCPIGQVKRGPACVILA